MRCHPRDRGHNGLRLGRPSDHLVPGCRRTAPMRRAHGSLPARQVSQADHRGVLAHRHEGTPPPRVVPRVRLVHHGQWRRPAFPLHVRRQVCRHRKGRCRRCRNPVHGQSPHRRLRRRLRQQVI